MTELQNVLTQFNQAFANNDVAYLKEHVTDDIEWTIVGDQDIRGKAAFVEALEAMAGAEPAKLNIEHVITHGKEASVNGTISMNTDEGEQTFAFCDVYKLNGHKDPKVSAMTSYVLRVN
ncbi:nuclear transport factor 2 family protein [Marinimicrobium sp. ABcell2]|uniref:nuclear transport factor 2 family protein n=1 Tax=Marinimicrobium sp. ABcell2 TaxID=3069751 RepID=UPI0027B62BDF|nr:nuclear transport factor 2 family protein [Marinimicrobium sp. ABcell2]MDQ2076695.1 nuclear transport factor 2 family protein [Marinimicrobium sp. ABcell2]